MKGDNENSRRGCNYFAVSGQAMPKGFGMLLHRLHPKPCLPSASPGTAMTHIAIQEQLDGKAVDWLEKVSDEQYQSK